MRNFQKGEKAKLAELTTGLQVTVGVSLTGHQAFDVSMFGVDGAGHLSDDRYMIFYNQRRSPEGAVVAEGGGGTDLEVFSIDLTRLPESIRRLVFTATIDGAGSMSDVEGGYVRVATAQEEVARYSFSGGEYSTERAVIVAEIYFKDVWRFSAVGQGFSGGLSALLKHFGGEEAPSPAGPGPGAAAGPSTPHPTFSPGTPSAGPVPSSTAVRLSKVTLEKKGQQRTVDLRKGGVKPIHFNLNWDQGKPKRGLLTSKLGGSAPDLDLGCMYELADGKRGVIQPLGDSFGHRDEPPFIFLDKDDRTGQAVDGENLYIFRPDLVRRAMVFALVYEGAKDFTSVHGRMTVTDQDGNETLVYLGDPASNRTFCAICTLSTDGSALTITKQELYFAGARQADEHFGFGFRWTAGRK